MLLSAEHEYSCGRSAQSCSPAGNWIGDRTWIFKDYQMRVAAVIRDYGLVEREQAPADSQAVYQG